jgi:hypothetical protein
MIRMLLPPQALPIGHPDLLHFYLRKNPSYLLVPVLTVLPFFQKNSKLVPTFANSYSLAFNNGEIAGFRPMNVDIFEVGVL